jgi:CBS domain-containing protein
MNIKEIMTETPACCTPDTKLEAVARLMREHDCGVIPVCEGTRLVGVVTDRDIACRAFTQGKNPLDVSAREIMSKEIVTVTEDDSVEAATALMKDRQLRRLPVMRNGRIVGIVSLADLARQLPSSQVSGVVTAVSRPTIEVAVPAP